MALDLDYLGSGLQKFDTQFIAGLNKVNYILQHSEMEVWDIKTVTY